MHTLWCNCHEPVLSALNQRVSIAFSVRSAGLTHNEMKVQQNIPRRQFRIAKTIQHGADGNRADTRTRLVDRRERNRQKAGVLDVIDADHSNVSGDIEFQIGERLEKVGRGKVVGAYESIGPETRHDFLHFRLIFRIHAAALADRCDSFDSAIARL